MNCPKCGSKNIKAQIIEKDKKERNKRILLLTAFLTIALALILGKVSLTSAILGVLLCIPIMLILRIVLLFIPAGTTTYMICYDCGKEWKA